MNYTASIVFAIINAILTFIINTILTSMLIRLKQKRQEKYNNDSLSKNNTQIKTNVRVFLVFISLFVAWVTLFFFYPRWQVLDTGHYHLGDNIFV